MSLYPSTIVPSVPYQVSDTFKTLSSPEYDSGIVVTKSLRTYPLFSAKLTYQQNNTWTDMETLYQFFMDHRGRGLTFTFFDFNGYDRSPIGLAWHKLYIGVGDGAQVNFDLPMVSSTTFKLYIDGVDQAANYTTGTPTGSQWKLTLGGGTDGKDYLTFGTAPASGKLLEWKATGRRAVTARFDSDVMSFSAFYNLLVSTGIGIVEARG